MIIELIILIFFIILLLLFLTKGTSEYPKILEYKSENYYFDDNGKEKPFPSINDPPTCYLSVIIPAYNEEKRLPTMIQEMVNYLEKRKSKNVRFTYEILIVDDGSSDGTSKFGIKCSNLHGSNKTRVLSLEKNRGKGGAVRLGMMRSRGEMLLFADADGATRFSDFEKLETELINISDKNDLSDSLGMVCGSRAHLEEASVAERSYFRTILMYAFHMLVWLFTVRGIKDTQCGFKLLTRRTARVLFKSLHLERWAFDVEMLYIAQALKISIKEVAVNWTEIEGSKVTPIFSWLQMGFDILFIWLRYLAGVWKINRNLLSESRSSL